MECVMRPMFVPLARPHTRTKKKQGGARRRIPRNASQSFAMRSQSQRIVKSTIFKRSTPIRYYPIRKNRSMTSMWITICLDIARMTTGDNIMFFFICSASCLLHGWGVRGESRRAYGRSGLTKPRKLSMSARWDVLGDIIEPQLCPFCLLW